MTTSRNLPRPYFLMTFLECSFSLFIFFVSLSRNKKINWKRPVEEAKKMKCYKTLIYKQFVQVSGLCGPAQSFPVICRNVSRTFVELCMETPYWCTVLVHQYGRWKSTKTSGVHFFYKSSFFSLEN